MKLYHRILLMTILASSIMADKVFKVPLTKHYSSNFKVADSEGKYHLNSSFLELFEEDDDVEIESEIKNNHNVSYFGKLWFSNSFETSQLDFIFDTGSSWLWAGTKECTFCPSLEKLPSSQFYGCNGNMFIDYESGMAYGEICFANVSASPNTDEAVLGMKMVAAESAYFYDENIVQWDGILGLSPSPMHGSDSFVLKMKQQKIIDTAAFGVYFGDDKYGSEITFGGIDTDRVPSIDKLTFTDLKDLNYWSVNIRSFKYGDTVLNEEARYGLIDTGTSMIILPYEDYKSFKTEAQKGNACLPYSSTVQCECEDLSNDELFDPIYVKFNSWEYKISPDQYVERRVNSNGVEICYPLVSSRSFYEQPTIILGDPFIRNYYIYHDIENRRVGLYENPRNESWPIQSILIGFALAIVFVGTCLWIYMKNYRFKSIRREEGILIESEEVELNQRN